MVRATQTTAGDRLHAGGYLFAEAGERSGCSRRPLGRMVAGRMDVRPNTFSAGNHLSAQGVEVPYQGASAVDKAVDYGLTLRQDGAWEQLA